MHCEMTIQDCNFLLNCNYYIVKKINGVPSFIQKKQLKVKPLMISIFRVVVHSNDLNIENNFVA